MHVYTQHTTINAIDSMGSNLFHVIRRGLQTREFIHLFVINISCTLFKLDAEIRRRRKNSERQMDSLGLSL